MKFRSYRLYDTRIVKKFALFPIKAYDEKYYIWLEWCYIQQTNCMYGWRNDCFVTKQDYIDFKREIKKYD
jgi:hypothetical protein